MKFRNAREPSRIELPLENILPSLDDIDPQAESAVQMRQAVEANVLRMERKIFESPEGRRRAAEGKYLLVGAIVDISPGEVRFLEQKQPGKLSAP